MKLIVSVLLIAGLLVAGCKKTPADKGPSEETLQSQGLSFAKDFMNKAGKSWDLEDVIDKFDKQVYKGNNRKDFENIFALYARNLGSIKKVKRVNEVEFKLSPKPTPETISCAAAYHFEFSSKKEEQAIADLSIYKLGDSWYVASINANSPNIKKEISQGNEQALKMASEIALKICQNWDIKVLKEHVTEKLKKEMESKDGEKMRTTLATMKAKYGTGQSIKKTKIGSSNLKGGSYHYLNLVTVTCQRGDIAITFLIINDAGKWKVEGFAFQQAKEKN